uniref:Glucose-1-phosphate thymidylyltransferase n=1 Tax=Thermosporothrix sp. COM3 TaxID=2490863 RepID=A0A455T2U0_9CHLR|nr:glucose-1-phosphate thymidylyltransferase [Thermosporothrix sp. COM3]
MKALVLSGGKGTRLHPLTYTNAKQLIPVANKPVLFYALEKIVAAGIYEIGIVVGDTREEIIAAVGDGRQFGEQVSISYIHQEQPLGLAHAVKLAQPFLQNDRFLMFLGDNFIEEPLGELVAHFAAPDCLDHAQVCLTRVEAPQQFGVALLSEEQERLVRVVEKPREPISDLAIVGVYLFDAHIFEAVNAIHPSARGELEITDAIQYLIDRGYRVSPHLLRGYWIDTGRMQDMLNANRTVLSQMQGALAPGVEIDERSCLYGEVVLEENVRLINSVVRGPSIIGRNVVLENTYIGPFTSIAHDTVVMNSEIEHSIILEGCTIQAIGGRIEDSLIGRHTQIYPTQGRPGAHRLLLGDHSSIGLMSA